MGKPRQPNSGGKAWRQMRTRHFPEGGKDKGRMRFTGPKFGITLCGQKGKVIRQEIITVRHTVPRKGL
jgi:hypothetical protein